MFTNLGNLLKLFNHELSEEDNENNSNIQNIDQNMVTHIYVIKRQLYNFHIKTTLFCHSALLLKTLDKYFILEYGSGGKELKNKVLLREIKSIQVKKYSVLEENYSWDKKHGRILKNPMHISNIYNMMQQNMNKRNYNVYYWNCHMAQERTRKQLGLDVPVKYEYYFILIIGYFLLFTFFSSLRIFDAYNYIPDI
jgi:hypothetical protein